MIPHYLALVVLVIGALFVYFFGWCAVLITGRYPDALFNYAVGVSRWSTRIQAYMFQMTDKYPPFSMGDDPSYPVRLTVERPRGLGDVEGPTSAGLMNCDHAKAAMSNI